MNSWIHLVLEIKKNYARYLNAHSKPDRGTKVPIEVSCSQCFAMLRVDDEHAGKKAKCPNCNSINEIPLTSADQHITDGSKDPAYAQGMPPVQTGQGQGGHPQHGTPQGYPPPGYPRQYAEQNRGGLIFALGLISLLMSCFIPGIIAYVMGKGDLARMKQGIMDPSGEGLTQAGVILGLISMILAVIGIVFMVLYFVFVMVILAGAAGANGGF